MGCGASSESQVPQPEPVPLKGQKQKHKPKKAGHGKPHKKAADSGLHKVTATGVEKVAGKESTNDIAGSGNDAQGQNQTAHAHFYDMPSVVSWVPPHKSHVNDMPSVVSWFPNHPAHLGDPTRGIVKPTSRDNAACAHYYDMPSVVSWVPPHKGHLNDMPSVISWFPNHPAHLGDPSRFVEQPAAAAPAAPGAAKYKLILVRHGESEWNVENRFTGWRDVPLAPSGEAESHRAAAAIKAAGMGVDVVYTSLLKRAIKTAMNVVEDLNLMHIPMVKDWRLNERHYGALEGLNKKEIVAAHGEEQVAAWRRGYDVVPPAMSESDELWEGNDKRYARIAGDVPRTESLHSVVDRVLPLWQQVIAPTVLAGKRVMIAAHGNTLRALVKVLDGTHDDAISTLNIPTAVPLVFELDEDLRPVKCDRSWPPLSGYYLGDQQDISTAINGVAAQTA